MESSANYPDLLEKGMRKKKKKFAQGEISKYDPDRAKKAELLASAKAFEGMKPKWMKDRRK